MQKDIITSAANQQIKQIIKLQKSAKERKAQRVFIVEGKKMFQEAKELQLIEKAYMTESFCEENFKEDTEIEFPYEILSESVFKQISDTMTPQGVLAIVKQTEYRLEDILEQKNAHLLFLEDLRDPGNLGTIMRTAEGAGVTGLILSKESVDFYNPKVVRSTMGSLFRVPFIYVDDFQEALKMAQKKNIALVVTDLRGKYNYDEENYNRSIGIVIGNEAKGISEATRKAADVQVKIPMCGKVESLNASVAAAIMMYEVFRQRRIC